VGRIGWAVVAVISVAVITAFFVVVVPLLRERPLEPVATLARPAPGEVRPDYLDDGTPVWVVGLADGDVAVLSAFSTHVPENLGKMLWWCPTAAAFEDPAHGSRYDHLGFKIAGPAPTGLPAYEVEVSGSVVRVGELGAPPPLDAPHAGLPAPERGQCFLPDDAADISFHNFDGWPVHDSPTEAVASAPPGWILLNGELTALGGRIVVCAVDDCTDAVPAAEITAIVVGGPGDPTPAGVDEWFIARVQDGAFVDLTRVLPLDGQLGLPR
jgi:hypothetical protein